MANLETKYLGLTLKNPLILSSSGLSVSVAKIKEAQEAGISAVVLKSVFEEQINFEAANFQAKSADNPEAFDYLQGYVTANTIEKYLTLIHEAKKAVTIPIIASINCFSDKKWIDFAEKFAEAGADALELNLYIMPDSRKKDAGDYEKEYFNIVKKVVKRSKIPVAVKISHHFTNLINVVDNIKAAGAKGVVMFNRFYEPDIDINKLEMVNSHVFSSEADARFALRWTAIISDQVPGIDISTSTGVHNAQGAIKMLLAGATTVQVCSVVYQKGMGEIPQIIGGIEQWMHSRGFDNVGLLRGLMSYKSIPDSSVYQRSQFMKYFSNFE